MIVATDLQALLAHNGHGVHADDDERHALEWHFRIVAPSGIRFF